MNAFKLGLAGCAVRALAWSGLAHAQVPPGEADLTSPLLAPNSNFTDDDLLLVELSANGAVLSDSFNIYASRQGVYVPLGALARQLDVAIDVEPGGAHAEGWVVDASRTIFVDTKQGVARVGGRELALGAGDAEARADDLYVRAKLIETLLPLKLSANTFDLTLSVETREKLPFEDRKDRLRRNGQIPSAGAAPNAEGLIDLAAPYRFFTAPTIDLDLDLATGDLEASRTGRFDTRLAGDFAWSTLQAYVGSDTDFSPASARVMLSRKDPNGRALGIGGVRRAELGDTYTPSLPLGARGMGGRGVFVSSEPLDRASVFNEVDLRGELPLGYQAELYVNEVLRASQLDPVRGQYDFSEVSLAYGLNTIRIVLYGPRGERKEIIKRIQVGANQLRKGEATYRFGAVEENRPVIGFGGDAKMFGVPSDAPSRVIGAASYGLSDFVTLNAGYSRYTPGLLDTRQMGSLGAVASVAGLALDVEAAVDDLDGSALSGAIAGRFGKSSSILVRHSEYRDGFADESRPSALLGGSLARATEGTLDTVLDFAGVATPATLRVERDGYSDGQSRLAAQARISRAIDRFLVSTSIDYENSEASGSRLDGTVDLTSAFSQNWQFRSSATLGIAPKLEARSLDVSADRAIGERGALRVSAGYNFQTSGVVLGLDRTWRLQKADLSLTSSYDSNNDDWRIGLRLAMSVGYDKAKKRYRRVEPGAAAGGAVQVTAFLDQNGNGIRDAGEEPASGVTLRGGRSVVTTGGDGLATAFGLGDGASARVDFDTTGIDDPYLIPVAMGLRMVPRPGRILDASLPIAVTGEVELQSLFQKPGAPPKPVSALHVQLLDAGGAVVKDGWSAFDGSLLIDGLPPGTFSVQLEPAQAAKLNIALVSPVHVTVKPKGGFVGRISVPVRSAQGFGPTPPPALLAKNLTGAPAPDGVAFTSGPNDEGVYALAPLVGEPLVRAPNDGGRK